MKRKFLKVKKEIKSIWEKVTNIEERQWRSIIHTIGALEVEKKPKWTNPQNMETINQENPQ